MIAAGVAGCSAGTGSGSSDARTATPTAAATRPAAAAVTNPPFDLARMAEADRAIEEAIAKGDCPGAVLLVGRGDRTGGKVAYQRAYGNRAVKPDPESMTLDTLFDLASLSKPVGCATSVMKLIEQGKVRPQERVAAYLPEFGKNGKEQITVAHLLLHQGGLIPDNALADYKEGPAVAWQKICDLKPQAEPGTTFKYTDVGFIVLGKLVERVSGRPLNEFARDEVFGPAGMATASYVPPADWKPRTAPTEQRENRWMRGEVHDPRAYLLGGVAGHAGLFGTAQDLSRYCRMLLNGGTIDGRQVLKPETVAEMTKPHDLPDGKNRRTYGFDVDTSYSRPRGDRFERGTTFGHTGFTGTSLWIDPVNDCYVVLLTNSVHPDGKGKVLALRHKVGTVAAEALLGPKPATQPATAPVAQLDAPPLAASQANAAPQANTALVTPLFASTAAQPTAPVSTGLDVLVAQQFKTLHGKRVALVTNHSGLDRDGRRILDLLVANKDVKLVKVFSPEHGLYGVLDEKVSDTTDPKTGLKVYSLYGAVRKPTAEMMAGVDALVFDIQDAGARYYTYISTMGACMESCAANKVKMVVLDRPNPVTGTIV
ncbi:MAG: Protein YzbB, partial [uncultured Phycisphaerae bacterium]